MTTILIKKKDTTGAPSSGDLTNAAGGAEIAVNTFDKRLYTKDSGGTVVELGTNPTDITTGTVDTTNIEVTNIKAKDGTAAGSIADSTGVVTLASSVLTTTDINGGTIDGVTLGTNSPVTNAQIDNININGNAITSTNSNGNIALTPNGTGEVDISKVDIDSGAIDGTTIGGASAAAGSFTTLNTSGAVVFNDAGADVDFRVEGDTDANLLFVDASTDRVGIGTSSPFAVLTTNPESGNFNATYNSYDGVGLYLLGNGTDGLGNYGPAVVFGACNSSGTEDDKHCAISSVQTDSDANQMGLAFWTHPSGLSTDALVEQARISANGNFAFNSGYGSVATAYGCRAWVNFDGTGTVAIRASGNVSSITDNGTGSYNVNFSTAMPDANFSAVASGRINEVAVAGGASISTTTVRVECFNATSTLTDVTYVFAAVFR